MRSGSQHKPAGADKVSLSLSSFYASCVDLFRRVADGRRGCGREAALETQTGHLPQNASYAPAGVPSRAGTCVRPPPRPRSLPIEPDTRNTGSAMANARISISQPARPTRSYTPAWLGHVATAACPVERITETASDPKHSWRYAREAASKHDRRSAGWTEG